MKPKSSGLNQEPTRNKVSWFGSWFREIHTYCLLVRYLVLSIYHVPGLTKKFRPYFLVIPGTSWF